MTDGKSANFSNEDPQVSDKPQHMDSLGGIHLENQNANDEDSSLSKQNKFVPISETFPAQEVESESMTPNSHSIEAKTAGVQKPNDAEVTVAAEKSLIQDKEQFASSGDVESSSHGSTTGEPKITNPSYGKHGQRASTPPTHSQAEVSAGNLPTPVSNPRDVGVRPQSPGFIMNTAQDQSSDSFQNQSRENETKNNGRSEFSPKATKSKLPAKLRATKPIPSMSEINWATSAPGHTFQEDDNDGKTRSDVGSDIITEKSQKRISDHKPEAATEAYLDSKVDHPTENEQRKPKSAKGKPKPALPVSSSVDNETDPDSTALETQSGLRDDGFVKNMSEENLEANSSDPV